MEKNHFLERFLNPKSVAIIGAGDDPLRINGRSLMFMLRHGSVAKLLPVNPNRDVVQGVPCYRRIADLPETPDVGMVIVNKGLVPEAIEELGKKGCPFAIITASGYGETGAKGREDQKDLVKLAQKYGIRLMGPNCMGSINLQGPIIMSWCATLERERGDLLSGDVGLVCQSGALLGSIWDMSMGHGLGYSSLLSTGNEADLEAADFVEYFALDEKTRVITAFIEALRNPKRFVEAVELAHKQQKPVIVYKVGRTEEASRSAASHTGALTGSDSTFEAICQAHGIIRVDNLNALATTAMVVRSQPPAKGTRVAIFSCSGGASGLVCDQLPSRNLSLAPVSQDLEQSLTTILGWGPPHNPLDIGKGPLKSLDVITQAMERFIKEDSFDQVIILMTMLYFIKVAPGLMLAGLKDKHGKPVMGCWIGDKIAAIPRQELIQGGIPAFRDAESCLDAAKALAFLGRFRYKRAKGLKPKDPPPEARKKAMTIIEKCGRRLDEASSKKILSLYGLPVPLGKVVKTLEEAKTAGKRIGFPLVAKGLSPDVLHKTEAGAVRLGISNSKELTAAFRQVSEAVRAHGGANSFRGVLLERMQPEPVAEIISGSVSDAFGFHTILFGLGGIWVEAMKDTTVRLAPLLSDDAEEMISEIRGHKILEGFRGKPPADRKAMLGVLMALSALVWDLKDQIKEIDLNPVLVYGQGAVAVDALIQLKD
jgi:acyl-CoA synthetase (NDP forming)